MQKDDPILRAATNADCAAVRTLVFEVLREYGLLPDLIDTDADLDDLEKHYYEGWFAVLEADGRIIGSVGLFPLGTGVMELRKMYIHREWRGRGLGRQLLERVLAEARRMGTCKVVLGTANVLVEAIGLYRRFGFQQSNECHSAARCDQVWELVLQSQPTK